MKNQDAKTLPLKPIKDRILVKLDDRLPTTGLIEIEDNSPKIKSGVIVAVGPGTYTEEGKHIPVQRSVGERCFFTFLGGVHVEDGYRIYAESEVLALYEE